MKTLLFIIFIAFTLPTYSQFFVGESKEEVIYALKNANIQFTEDKLTDSTSRISWLKENQFQMIWVLNRDSIVTRQTLIPEKDNGLNEFVKWFNKDFVIVSLTEWRNYLKGRIYQIKLEYMLNEPFISITLLPSS
jgi:hypothetical protein